MFLSAVNRNYSFVEDAIAAVHWTRAEDRGAEAPLGSGTLGQGRGEVVFLMTPMVLSGDDVLGCKKVALPVDGWALRVDEVAFPVGAIAHRHTHSGAGWRYLVSGTLRIEAERETKEMRAGECWFEPADAPVRAVATHMTGVTRFVRCMVIPKADIGKSTFRLQSPEDANLPRLQLTYRHFDHIVQLDAG